MLRIGLKTSLSKWSLLLAVKSVSFMPDSMLTTISTKRKSMINWILYSKIIMSLKFSSLGTVLELL